MDCKINSSDSISSSIILFTLSANENSAWNHHLRGPGLGPVTFLLTFQSSSRVTERLDHRDKCPLRPGIDPPLSCSILSPEPGSLLRNVISMELGNWNLIEPNPVWGRRNRFFLHSAHKLIVWQWTHSNSPKTSCSFMHLRYYVISEAACISICMPVKDFIAYYLFSTYVI